MAIVRSDKAIVAVDHTECSLNHINCGLRSCVEMTIASDWIGAQPSRHLSNIDR
jgi:hypothetical protein